MISQPMSAEQRQAMFDQLLALAMTGEPPPTENGLGDAVFEALIVVAGAQTKESADAARAAYGSSI
jgi:hypothetical protein